MQTPRPLVSLLALCAALASARAADDEPFVHLVEAENAELNTADVKVLDDAAADGGKYGAGKGDYQPIVMIDLPTIVAPRVSIWVRNRGQAIQLKGLLADGNQADLNWDWSKPAEWKWINLGTYERERVAAGLLIIRAPDSAANAGIDAVIVTSDLAFRPQSKVVQ
jgi:hypothetical protein